MTNKTTVSFDFDPVNHFPDDLMTPQRKSLLEDLGILHNDRGEIMESLNELAAAWSREQAARPAYDVSLYGTPSNNHGCRGFEVQLIIIDERTARVISGSSCNSCWQVGHDNADSPIAVGTIVQLPGWCANWDEASAPYGRSHNELVDDSDYPQSDCSFVRPSDLLTS